MKEYFFDRFRVLENDPAGTDAAAEFPVKTAEKTLRFHRSVPGYEMTPLVSLDCAAKQHQVRGIYVKDESYRFGLKAFKGLGGSYCMFRILCEKLGLDETKEDFSTFQREDVRRRCSRFEFATATDGNHGKGVSWAAGIFGCKAHVFMPEGTVEARRKAIEEAGSAEAVITDLNYDRTVQYTASLAEKNGWILIQDTAWEGYEKYPKWIIEGYLTLAAEASLQMNGILPTHIFLQAGVGSMAGGIEAYFINRCGDKRPSVTIVEPEAADCIYRSAAAGDGQMHSVPGDPVTIMAGLNCGTPCRTVWPVLRDCSSFFCACMDSVTAPGMSAYAKPSGTDLPVISGESGAVTYGLLLSILESEEARKLFKMDKDSVILLISTESDTDPEGYRRAVDRV